MLDQVNGVVQWLVIFALVGKGCQAGNQLVGYNCSSYPHQTISLTEVGSCPEPSESIKVDSRIGQLVVLEQEVKFKALRCQIEIYETVWNCGMYSHLSLFVPRRRISYPMSHKICEGIGKELKWEYAGEMRTLRYGVNQDSITHGGYFNKDTADCDYQEGFEKIKVYEYKVTLLREKAVYSYSHETITMNGVEFKKDDPCDAIYGCLDLSELEIGSCSSGQIKGLYTGQVEKYTVDERTMLLITDNSQGGVELLKNTTICGFSLTTTNEETVFYSDIPYPRVEPAGPMALSTYLTSQMSYLHYSAATERAQLASSLAYAICKVERKVLQNTLAILRSEPKMVSHIHYKELLGPGVHAVRSGEVMYLFECDSVDVQVRDTDGTCYEYLPVIAMGKNMFMTPFNHYLTEVSPVISCSTPVRSMYQFGNVWFDISAQAIGKSPLVLAPSKIKKMTFPKPFLPKGMMTEKNYLAFKDSLSRSVRRESAGIALADTLYSEPSSSTVRAEYNGLFATLNRKLSSVASGLEKFGAWCGLIGFVLFGVSVLRAGLRSYALWGDLKGYGVSIKKRLFALCCYDSIVVREMEEGRKPLKPNSENGEMRPYRAQPVAPTYGELTKTETPQQKLISEQKRQAETKKNMSREDR